MGDQRVPTSLSLSPADRQRADLLGSRSHTVRVGLRLVELLAAGVLGRIDESAGKTRRLKAEDFDE